LQRKAESVRYNLRYNLYRERCDTWPFGVTLHENCGVKCLRVIFCVFSRRCQPRITVS